MATFSRYALNIFIVLLIIQFLPPLINNIQKQYDKLLELKTSVGCLTINGTINNSQTYTKCLKKYFENPDIKAILLIIDSAGGAAGAGEAIAQEIVYLKKEFPKPIITLSENICASAAYIIAAATDFIICSSSTLIGSIGCTVPHQFKLNDLIEHYHIHYNSIKTGDYKSATDPFVANTKEQNSMLEQLTKDSYKNCTQFITQQRHTVSINKTHEWANGQIFAGNRALQRGLVDAIGSQSTAEQIIKERAIIKGTIEWIKPHEKSSWFNFLARQQPEDSTITSKIINACCSTIEQRYGFRGALC